MKNRRGFTLVEIMIVVAIIALLAAIAIPNLLRARSNANEAAAVAGLKTIVSAAISFRSVNNAYPGVLTSLAAPNATPPYIDSVLGCTTGDGCPKSGYSFSLLGSANTFTATATPLVYQTTGNRSFMVNESGVIYFTTTNTVPTTASSALE